MTPAQEAAAHDALRVELDRLLALANDVDDFVVTECRVVHQDHTVTHVNDRDDRIVRSSCSCDWTSTAGYVWGAGAEAMGIALAAGESHLRSQQFAGVL